VTHLRDVGFSPVRIVAMVINEDEKPIIKSVDQIAVKANGSPDAAETAVGTIRWPTSLNTSAAMPLLTLARN
jgi:hypothetical protein